MRVGKIRAVLVGIVLFASCGNGDESSEGEPSSEEFCEKVRDVQAAWEDDTREATDYLELVELLTAIEPPDAIADDWRASFGASDSPETDEASNRVLDYLQDECNVQIME